MYDVGTKCLYMYITMSNGNGFETRVFILMNDPPVLILRRIDLRNLYLKKILEMNLYIHIST